MTNNPKHLQAPSPLNLIAIGASPEALHSLLECLNALPPANDDTLILILHLAALDTDKMADLLNKTCEWPINSLPDNDPLRPGRAYLIRPNTALAIRDEHLYPSKPSKDRTMRQPIDVFFQNLADLHRPDIAAILLANNGEDGLQGLQAIRSAGGLCFLEASPDDNTTIPSTLDLVAGEHILPAQEIAPLLTPELFRTNRPIPAETLHAQEEDDASPETSPEPPADPTSSDPSTDETRRILIVDRNKDITEMLSLLLVDDGHQTRQARHIDAALETAKDFQPHIAIIDIDLPNQEGFTLAEDLRAEFGSRIHLLAISNFREIGDHLIEAGFDWHFSKPPHFDALLAWLATREIESP